VYARYHRSINSTELITRLRVERSVLVVPGDHFGMDHYLRLGFGDDPEHLRAGLDRLAEGIADIGVRVAESGAHREAGRESTINPQ
jgi:aspartate/methionine/tyrosine aminotransferase